MLTLLRPIAWTTAILMVLIGITGCTRKFFRTRADDDVIGVLTQKNQYPQWAIENWHVYPDPRARYADPDNPDRPNRPPDDLAAHLLSPNPQPGHKKKQGLFEGTRYLDYLATWDRQNRLARGQKPIDEELDRKMDAGADDISPSDEDTFQNVLRSRERPFLINLEQSMELGLFNSREFQERREDLYLSALPVTLERFSFVAQWFATEQVIREFSGNENNDAGSRWRMNSETGFSKLFPTGATLLVRLANRLVLEIGQGKVDVGLSNLTVELTQPLLRGGGYAVTLEPLTQAERTLLYAIRSYARFRKVYYVYLAGGGDIFNAPYTYTGLTGRGTGLLFTAPTQGFMPTLLLTALERNEVENIAALERYRRRFEAIEQGGDVSKLQVDQVEQQLLRGRSSLLQRRLDLQNGLDQFKLQLGLPTSLPLELDDRPLQPLREQVSRFSEVQNEFNDLRTQAEGLLDSVHMSVLFLGGGRLSTAALDVPLRQPLRKLLTEGKAVQGTSFQNTILPRWEAWQNRTVEELEKELRRLQNERKELIELGNRLDAEGKKLSAEQEQKLKDLRTALNIGLLEAYLRIYEAKPWLKQTAERRYLMQANVGRDVINQLNLVIAEPREQRLDRMRETWPALPPVEIDGVDLLRDDLDKAQTVVAQTALSNRIELMNARAQLVDSWRQVAVRANALMGVLDVQYNLSAASPEGSNEPLNFAGSRSRHQLVINGELPLVRREERNIYRTALIAYQRQRRQLQATEDFILNDVRTGLRQLRVLAENYKIQRRAVEVAYAQVENSFDVLQAPPDPTSRAPQSAGNAAALTQQLLNAQTSLLQAQNALYNVWVSYLIARMQLYRDLELLSLDARGVWTDEYIPAEPPGGPELRRDAAPSERLPEPTSGGNPGTPRFAEFGQGSAIRESPRETP